MGNLWEDQGRIWKSALSPGAKSKVTGQETSRDWIGDTHSSSISVVVKGLDIPPQFNEPFLDKINLLPSLGETDCEFHNPVCVWGGYTVMIFKRTPTQLSYDKIHFSTILYVQKGFCGRDNKFVVFLKRYLCESKGGGSTNHLRNPCPDPLANPESYLPISIITFNLTEHKDCMAGLGNCWGNLLVMGALTEKVMMLLMSCWHHTSCAQKWFQYVVKNSGYGLR